MMRDSGEPPDFAQRWTEADKLRVIEETWDWTGIDDRQKKAMLAGEVDFARITRDELNSVYESIGLDEVDERPARRLFDEANYARALAEAETTGFDEQLRDVRSTARNLIESVMLDDWPRSGSLVDFGIDGQRHYEALSYPIRNGEIEPIVLDAAMGNGEKLTALARRAESNPHKDIEFHTSWDVLLGRDKPDSPGREPREPSDYERAIDEAAKSAAAREQPRGKDVPER